MMSAGLAPFLRQFGAIKSLAAYFVLLCRPGHCRVCMRPLAPQNTAHLSHSQCRQRLVLIQQLSMSSMASGDCL